MREHFWISIFKAITAINVEKTILSVTKSDYIWISVAYTILSIENLFVSQTDREKVIYSDFDSDTIT